MSKCIKQKMESHQEWIQRMQLEQIRKCQEIAELFDSYSSKWIH